jgi:isoleucyl-tRNA synthetase
MKQVAAAITQFNQEDISKIEKDGTYDLNIDNQPITIAISDVEIISEDIPGWLVTNIGNLTVALDVNITESLKEEGIARELVNRIQNLRKDKNFEVTDKINVKIQKHEGIVNAVLTNKIYICTEILANELELVDEITDKNGDMVEVDDNIKTLILINKI